MLNSGGVTFVLAPSTKGRAATAQGESSAE